MRGASRRGRVAVVALAGSAAMLVAGCGASGESAVGASMAGGSSTSSSPATEASPPAPIPDGFLLPDEGQASEAPGEITDWTTDNAVGTAWLIDPCAPTDYPTDRQRTSFRTVSRTGPELYDARQLAVYPTPDVAAEVLAGFRRALAACGTGTRPDGSRWQWTSEDARGLGDDGLVAASTSGPPVSSPSGDRIAVTRVGAAVFLAHAGGEYGTAELDGGAEQVRVVAERFVDSL